MAFYRGKCKSRGRYNRVIYIRYLYTIFPSTAPARLVGFCNRETRSGAEIYRTLHACKSWLSSESLHSLHHLHHLQAHMVIVLFSSIPVSPGFHMGPQIGKTALIHVCMYVLRLYCSNPVMLSYFSPFRHQVTNYRFVLYYHFVNFVATQPAEITL